MKKGRKVFLGLHFVLLLSEKQSSSRGQSFQLIAKFAAYNSYTVCTSAVPVSCTEARKNLVVFTTQCLIY